MMTENTIKAVLKNIFLVDQLRTHDNVRNRAYKYNILEVTDMNILCCGENTYI